jgi:hypothetical protein
MPQRRSQDALPPGGFVSRPNLSHRRHPPILEVLSESALSPHIARSRPARWPTRTCLGRAVNATLRYLINHGSISEDRCLSGSMNVPRGRENQREGTPAGAGFPFYLHDRCNPPVNRHVSGDMSNPGGTFSLSWCPLVTAGHGPRIPQGGKCRCVDRTRTGHMALGGVVFQCIAFQDALALAKLQKNTSPTANKPMPKLGELGQSSPKAPAEDSNKDAVPIPFLGLPFEAKSDAIAAHVAKPVTKTLLRGPSRCRKPDWPRGRDRRRMSPHPSCSRRDPSARSDSG